MASREEAMTVYEVVMQGVEDDADAVSFGLFATEERALQEIVRRGPDFEDEVRWRIVAREVQE